MKEIDRDYSTVRFCFSCLNLAMVVGSVVYVFLHAYGIL